MASIILSSGTSLAPASIMITFCLVEATARFYGTFEAQAHGKEEGVLVRMTCYTAEFEGELRADSEIAEMVWLTCRDMESVSPVDKLIFGDLRGKGMLD